jgi:polyhydroxyalkanoate synthesis repressor PhaR
MAREDTSETGEGAGQSRKRGSHGGREHARNGAERNGAGQPIVIKKYANRRLYNTATSSYVTLDHLCQMVKDDVDFAVYDAKTGEDITRSVLTQIIVEEESKGTNLLPITFLRQLIGFYGHNMQAVVPRYLDHMMQAFADNQDRMRQQLQDTMSGMFPFGGDIQRMGEQNAALFESAMKMFTPFGHGADSQSRGETRGDEDSPANEGRGGGARDTEESLNALKQQVDLLQQQLDQLSRQQAAGRKDGDDEGAGGGNRS